MKSLLLLAVKLFVFSAWLGLLGLLGVFFLVEGLVTRLLGGPTCDVCGRRLPKHDYNCIENPRN